MSGKQIALFENADKNQRLTGVGDTLRSDNKRGKLG